LRSPNACIRGVLVCAGLIATALLAAGHAAPVRAFVPKVDRVVSAVARANTKSGRSQALLFNLTLRVGDSEVLATGELVTHPSGFARLELRGAGELVERHLLQGMEHTASRNGSWLPEPRPLLPPLFFVQAESGTSLRAAMSAFGIDSELIGLSVCGDADCFVVGDPARVASRVLRARLREEAARAAEDQAGWQNWIGADAAGGAREGLGPTQATLWVDSQTFRVRKLELSGGVVVELGPPMTSGKLETPQWVVIREPEHAPIRLEFTQVMPVSAPASSFGQTWLLSGETDSGIPEP
jgi:hypothetical protein